MTHTRLMQELGPGELAYQIAQDEMDVEDRTERAEHARTTAERREIGRKIITEV